MAGYTTVAAVGKEVPGFVHGGRIPDTTIQAWIDSISQGLDGVLLRRGLDDQAQWHSSALGVLEGICRMGAAARLASAVGGQFGAGEWGLEKSLRESYLRELKALQFGEWDKLFRASASTVETGAQVSTGGPGLSDDPAFTKGQIF